MSTPGIEALGTYAPRFRIEMEEIKDTWAQTRAAGIESKAVPDGDEDSLTMAFEAADRALAAADRSGEDIDRLMFASTTPPLEEENLAVRLGEMLGLSKDAERDVRAESTASGTRALLSALQRSEDRSTLVVASDAPRGLPDDSIEHHAGAGAAAAVITPDADMRLVDWSLHADPYPGVRFRQRGASSTKSLEMGTYEKQAFLETLEATWDDIDCDTENLDAFVVQAPDGDIPKRAANSLGIDQGLFAAPPRVAALGDTGAASSLLDLAGALDAGADHVLVIGYGSGSIAVGLLLEGGEPVEVSESIKGSVYLGYDDYLRRRGTITSGGPSGGGAYVSVPTWRRTLAQRYRRIAGRCAECGTLNFPPEGACNQCHQVATYEPTPLSTTGRVKAVSIVSQGGAPSEFTEYQARSGAYATAIVAFEAPDGDTASVPAFVVDTDPASVSVGDEVSATIRRIYTQEEVTRYGFKVKPI